MNSPGTHISTVTRIITVILPGFGLDKNIQRELKVINKRLTKEYSKLYSSLTGKLSTLFPKNIEKLIEDLEYFEPILESSVGLENEQQMELFQRKFLNSLLRSKNINLEMLEFDYIKEEVLKIPGKGVSEIQAVFKSRIAILTSLKAGKIKQSYLEVYRLWMLSTYDFERLLSKFEKKNVISNGITLTSCYGDIIVEELKDLYYLCAEFKPDKSGFKMLKYLSNIMEDGLIDEHVFLSHYAGIQEFLNRTAPAETLNDIIKSSIRNPLIELKKPEIVIDFIQKIQTSILAKFKTSRDAYQKEIAENAYRSQISNLFESNTLSSLEGYSGQVSKTLISNELPGFLHITALRLLKSFALLFYDDEIKPIYDNFLQKVGFISLNFENSLRNAIISCNELNNSIQKFEKDLLDPQYSKLLPIINHCTQKTIKKEDRKQMSTTINGINQLAVRIVETGTSELHVIMQAGLNSIEDIKTKNPTIVDNSRYIRDSERELLKNMEQATSRLLQIMEIMKHFSVNKDLIRKWKNGLVKK
jgi:hypothetical protein